MPRKRDTKSKVPRKKLIKEEISEVSESGTGIFREVLTLLISGLALFILFALLSYTGATSYQHSVPSSNAMGQLGYFVSRFLFEYLGYCSYAVVGCLFLAARFVWSQRNESTQLSSNRVFLSSIFGTLLVVATATLSSIVFGSSGGGYIGYSLAGSLTELINTGGTVLLSLLAILLSLSVIIDFGIPHYLKLFYSLCRGAKLAAQDTGTVIKVGARAGSACLKKIPDMVLAEEDVFIDSPPVRHGRKLKRAKRVKKKESWQIGEEEGEIEEESFHLEEEEIQAPRILRGAIATKKQKEIAKSVKEKSYDDYELPSRDLLVGVDAAAVDGPGDEELLKNSRRLEQALRNFKIGGKVVEVHPGPVVTLYQFEPAAGIKVQRIINLADDLALALKVESVRVYAPVPGKGTVGIEVPNEEREIVRLRDLVDSDEFQTRPYPLSLALGKDTYGQSFISDLSKMPHLLIAGATGTGKSVCINSLLMSLLYRNSPKDLRLILIDPKMLELSVYEKIPHLLSPVITNPKRARGVLYWAVEEMERRYSLMKDIGVRDLAMFNRSVSEGSSSSFKKAVKKKKDALITLEEKDVVSTTAAEALQREAGSAVNSSAQGYSGLETMPRIVIVVDELADLMLTVGREIEELLTRLAQKARAAGIHLILATQRPSVNVITGLIKANFPARISFKVTSKIDARTIMDQSGAERLLGQGDMLFYSPAIGRVKRLHSPFVSDQEVHDVVNWIQSQGEPDYDSDIERVLKVMEENEGGGGGFSMNGDMDDSYDPLYDQAVSLVLEKGQASTSMVQRVFRIGYNRAARILETMEKEGVVGPADGAKPRQVISAQIQ